MHTDSLKILILQIVIESVCMRDLNYAAPDRTCDVATDIFYLQLWGDKGSKNSY